MAKPSRGRKKTVIPAAAKPSASAPSVARPPKPTQKKVEDPVSIPLPVELLGMAAPAEEKGKSPASIPSPNLTADATAAASQPVVPKARSRKPVTIQLTAPVPAKTSREKRKRINPSAGQTPEGEKAVGQRAPGKKIVFIASECTPLASTGGLGDVVAGLSKALLKRGHEVRVIMPLYSQIDRARFGITFSRPCCVHFGGGEEIWVGIFEGKLDHEVPIWFIDYARFFERPWIYDGSDQDAFRFGLLSKAALQACKDCSFIPDIAHLHDWMTAPAAVFLKTWDRVLSPLSKTASVLTIHNIGYQGKFHPSALAFYGLGAEYMTPDRFEDFGVINLLKAGIQYADAITTVSPTYAQEIRGPIGGIGLGLYLNNRSEHVFGILNGVDVEIWNPATDPYLPARFDRENMSGKAACKRALQERFGLMVDPKIPLFAVVSRFATQKGFDLLRGALPQALRDMVMQVVVLGTGDAVTENFFRWLSGAFPGRANAHIGFSHELAHLIEAGSDFFLMPSLYEPCGLNQMYSSIYGTPPIVRATGGLEDTVENYEEWAGRGTGFKFSEISDRALYYTIGWAVSTWFDRPHHYTALQRQGMSKDFSWEASAQAYESVYAHAEANRAAL